MNIIFDLGGVVFKWDFAAIIDDVLNDAEKRDLILNEIHYHQDWVEFDRGTLSLEQVVKLGSERTGLDQEDIKKVMLHIPKSLVPYNTVLNLIERVKKTDNHKLYVLSNMPSEYAAYIEKNFTFWNKFDGIVFSSRIKMVKPDIEIYEYLINKHSIVVGETIFIDDREENLLSASKLGMKTILFKNPYQCEKELLKWSSLN